MVEGFALRDINGEWAMPDIFPFPGIKAKKLDLPNMRETWSLGTIRNCWNLWE